MKVLDLFSGIGGFSLGLERAGMETIAFVEIDPFCQKVLKKHWPDVHIHEDIKRVECWECTVPYYDVLCGGFPCQPFSTASHGVIVAEDLWPYMQTLIETHNPKYVIAENVAKKPILKAENYMKGLGYGTWVGCISVAQAGGPHRRNRWWLCAYPHNKGELSSAINAETSKLQELCKTLWGPEDYARTVRVLNGIPDRMDRIKSLGNTILPAIPEAIGRAIISTIY